MTFPEALPVQFAQAEPFQQLCELLSLAFVTMPPRAARTFTPWLSEATSLSRIASSARPWRERRNQYTNATDATAPARHSQKVSDWRVAFSIPRRAVRLVPEPPPTADQFAMESRNTSAMTHVPMAK